MLKFSSTLSFIIIFIPFLTLILIVLKFSNFITFINNHDSLKTFKFKTEFSLKSLLKSNLKVELKKFYKSDSQIYKNFFKNYNSLIISIFSHIVFGIIFTVFTCYKIYCFFYYKDEFLSLPIDIISINIVSTIVSIIFIWELFVNPILFFLGFKEIHLFNKFKDLINYFGEKAIKIFVGFWITLLSAFILTILDRYRTKILIHFNLEDNFISSLIFLLVYQYIITKILSLIFTFTFNLFINLINKVISKYCKVTYHKEIFITRKYCYEYFKVTTYLVLVYLYGYFSCMGLSSMILPSAIGVLFVLDTYFDKVKNLKK